MESVGVITDEKQNYNYNINDSHNSADSAAVLSIFSTLLIGVSLLLALYLLWSIWNWYNLRNQKATSLRTISIRTGHVQLMDDTTATVIRSLDSIDKQKDWVAACGHTIVLQKRKTFSGWLIQLLLSSESSDKVAVVAHPTTAKLLQTRYTKATDNSNSSKNFNNSSTVIKDGEFSALSYHHPFLQEFLHFPLWKFVLRLLTKAFRLTTIIQSRESKVEAKIVDEEVQNTSALPSSDGSTTNADNFHDEVGVTVTDLSVAYGHLIWSDPRLFEKIVMVLVRVCHAIDTNSLRILPTKSSEASKNSRNNSASGIKDYNGRNILLEDYRSMRSSHGSISSVDSDTRDEKSKGKKSNSGSNYHKYYHNSEDGRNSYAYNSNGKLEEENSTGETTGLVEIDAICGQSVLDILLNILFGRNLWVDAESILTAIRELRDCSVKLNTMSLRDSWSAFVELRELENVKRKAWSMIDRVTRPEIEVLLAEVEGKFKTPLNRSDRSLLPTILASDTAYRKKPLQQIIADVRVFLMIGVESVVPSLAKTFSLLADPAYANTSAGVIQEIRNAVGGRFPSLVTLQRSPQAIGIYMETVRLFPTFFVAKAIATKDVTLTEVENSARTNSTDYQERKNVIGANTLSKGSEIFFLLFAVQRHASVRGSGNPEAIEPQRWIQPPASHPFLNTFSSTENANPLISLTMLSAHLTLVMLLDRYDFFPPDASEHPTTNCLRVKAKTL